MLKSEINTRILQYGLDKYLVSPKYIISIRKAKDSFREIFL